MLAHLIDLKSDEREDPEGAEHHFVVCGYNSGTRGFRTPCPEGDQRYWLAVWDPTHHRYAPSPAVNITADQLMWMFVALKKDLPPEQFSWIHSGVWS